MSVVCRFTTVAALMLHLIFGCSLHHVAACAHHDHEGCHHTGESILQSVQQNHVCDHDHSHEGVTPEENDAQVADSQSRLAISSCACDSLPCDGDHPGCHGDVECSFVPSSDVVFIIDAPFVAYVTYEFDSLVSIVSSMAKCESFQRSARLAKDSLSQCASLCTWII